METLTIKDLKRWEQEGWLEIVNMNRNYIKIGQGQSGKSGPTISIGVEKTGMARKKPGQWRKITARLRGAGFRHIGGGNGWHGMQKNGKWCIGMWDMFDL